MEKTWGMGLIGPENRGTGFMIDIAVRDLKKEYEVGQPVLDGLTFQVDTGERVGILGRNGAGKTTLFRILTGQEEADSGEVILSPGKRLGLISQIPVYPAGYTVEDVLRTAFDDLKAMEAELHQISDQLGSGDKDLLARYDRLQAAYPQQEHWITCSTVEETAQALSSGAILEEKIAAVAGVYGYCLAAMAHQELQQTPQFQEKLDQAKALLLASRPGSRELAAALDFMEHPPEA